MSRYHSALCLTAIVIGCAVSNSAYSQQFTQVEVSEVLFGTGQTVLSSSADGAVDLMVGVTGLESVVMVNPIPPGLPFTGTFAQLFGQANSLDCLGSSANAQYVYEFSVPFGAEELFLN